MSTKDVALDWISENSTRIIEISDKIWEYAELPLKEYKSSNLLMSELQKHGYKVTRGVADLPTAFIASYGEGEPVIGILGEYDALPGLSQKPIPRKEPLKNGAPGHGCGHNIHGTSGIAAAIAVKTAIEKDAHGSVKFFGCPAEETVIGKVFMVQEGVFDNVDTVLSHHPGSMNAADLLSTNAMNSVKFHFKGIAAHAASSPDQGKSALDAVELMNTGVNFLREHVIQEARIHYVIEDGGKAPNIVPSRANSWYYIRAPERWQVESIYNKVLNIAKGADLMVGTTHEVQFITGTHNKLPNVKLSELVTENMRMIGAPEYSKEELDFAKKIADTIPLEEKKNALKKKKILQWEKLVDVVIDTSIHEPWGLGETLTASTDVGDVSWKTPTIEFWTATYPLGIPGHSWQKVAVSKTSLGHKSLIFAAKVLAGSAIDLLTNNTLLKEVHTAFLESKKNKIYKSPLPPDAKPPIPD